MSYGIRFDPEIGQRICDELSAGRSLTAICTAPDMPDRSTVRRWLATPEHAAFREAQGLAAYQAAGPPGATFIPVQTSSGGGTAGAHWSEAALGNELMTPYINNPNNLS